jgi:hypothetical protein
MICSAFGQFRIFDILIPAKIEYREPAPLSGIDAKATRRRIVLQPIELH